MHPTDYVRQYRSVVSLVQLVVLELVSFTVLAKAAV